MMVEDENNMEVVEWTITNFSCWNENIHDAVIESQVFGGVLGVALKLELQPKGPGDHLLARIRCDEPASFQGVFCVVGPDGSTLCSSEYDESGETIVLVGPKFEEVVAHIRKNEDRDQLTLKFRMRWRYSKVMLARTEITAFRSSWKVSWATLKNLQPGFNWISRTCYPHGSTMGEMDLVALRSDDFILRLDHESNFVKNVLVFVNISVLDKDGVATATEDVERVYRERDDWTFWKSPFDKDLSLVLRIKIVPSVKYKHQGAHYMPTLVSRHCFVDPSNHQP